MRSHRIETGLEFVWILAYIWSIVYQFLQEQMNLNNQKTGQKLREITFRSALICTRK